MENRKTKTRPVVHPIWTKKCLEDLKLSFETALVLHGGPGILSAILLKDKSLKGIVNIDKSPDFESVAIRLNHKNHGKGRFNAITKDIFDLNYKRLNLVIILIVFEFSDSSFLKNRKI